METKTAAVLGAGAVGSYFIWGLHETLGGSFWVIADGSRSERVNAVEVLLRGSSVRYIICNDIIHEIWSKYMMNIGNNLPQGMVDCGFGAYGKSLYLDAIRQKLRQEVAEIAAAKGIDLSAESGSISNQSGFVPGVILSPKSRFSTLQDLDAGRPTEIEMFSGMIMKLGKELGIATPYNEFTYYIIKTLEEKNDGRFE